ncbi:MAG: hybrid sensor histidine kinase/response regulator, partial [Cyanobacteria bacterium J069]
QILDRAIASIGQLRLHRDRTWTDDYCSAGCEQVFGFTAAEMMAGIWWSRVLPADRESAVLPSIDAILAGQPCCTEYRFQHKDGSLRWISSKLATHWDAEQGCWAVVFVDTDITDYKRLEAEYRQTETALRQSEERFRQIASSISQFFFIRDAQSQQYLYASPAYETIWGRSCESLYQNPDSWLEAVHPGDRPALSDSLAQQFQGSRIQHEYRVCRPDGEIRWVKLINDILEVSKIEAGQTRLNESRFDLYQLLDGLGQMLRFKAAEKIFPSCSIARPTCPNV